MAHYIACGSNEDRFMETLIPTSDIKFLVKHCCFNTKGRHTFIWSSISNSDKSFSWLFDLFISWHLPEMFPIAKTIIAMVSL